jgi:hypothetical protein
MIEKTINVTPRRTGISINNLLPMYFNMIASSKVTFA